MTDRLTLTRALESGGMQSAAAERIATEIYDAIHDNVATKSDLEALRLALEHQITRMTIRLGVLVIAVAGLASTIVHFWR
jgi:hypothetical protein